MRRSFSPFQSILLASVSLFAVSAMAAEPAGKPAPPQATPASEASGGDADEKVTVTARRVEESLQDTPVAVSAFSEKQLERLGAENVGALQGSVPNLNIVQGRGSNSSANIFIRGVGQPDALATFDPAVGVYVDDVYISRIRGALFDVYDMARVEVLRGPQGTLYGKNTIGGALKIVTLKPAEEFSGRVQVGLGNYNLFEVKARASGAIGENLRGLISLYSADRDGYVTDPVLNREYNDKNTKAGRVSLYWDASEKTEVRLNLDYTHEKPKMTVGRQENTLSLASGFSLIPPPAGEFNFQTRTTASLPNNQNVLDHYGAGLTVTHELDKAWTIKSISSARALSYTDYIDIDATQFEAGDVLVDVDQSQMSQEVQFLYDNGGPVRMVGGLYALKETIKSHQEAYGDDLFFATTFTRFIDDDQDTTSLAAFASVDYDISPTVTLTGGLRFTDEQKDYFRTTTIASSLLAFTLPPFSPVTFNVSDSWQDVSPNVTLTWRPSDDRTFYAKVSKGFKSGGFNGRANGVNDPRAFEPEELWSYEAGAKLSFLDGKLTANSAIFYNQYKDFQARVSRGDVFSAVFGVINAGELTQTGAELELFYRPIRELSLQMQLGLLDASYEEFFDPRFLPLSDPRNDRSWQTPAFSPKVTLRLGGVYTVPLAEDGSIDIGGDANYRSEMALAVDNADYTSRARFGGMFQDDYWLFNARVAWLSADGRYSVALQGKNLSDEVYKVDAQEFSSVAGIRTSYFGAPRTVQVVVGVNF